MDNCECKKNFLILDEVWQRKNFGRTVNKFVPWFTENRGAPTSEVKIHGERIVRKQTTVVCKWEQSLQQMFLIRFWFENWNLESCCGLPDAETMVAQKKSFRSFFWFICIIPELWYFIRCNVGGGLGNGMLTESA